MVGHENLSSRPLVAALIIVLAFAVGAEAEKIGKASSGKALKKIAARAEVSPKKVKAQNIKGTLVVHLPQKKKAAASLMKAVSTQTAGKKKITVSTKQGTKVVKRNDSKKKWVEQKKIPSRKIIRKAEPEQLTRKPERGNTKMVRYQGRPLVHRSAPSPVVRAGHEATAKSLIRTALHYLKTAYRMGGSGPAGFDCSGFTSYVFRTHGISLPRSSVDQAREGMAVDVDELKTGDLVFFSTFRKGISHVGIFIANGLFIHSAGRGKGVSLDSLRSEYWSRRYRTARRVDLEGGQDYAKAAAGESSAG